MAARLALIAVFGAGGSVLRYLVSIAAVKLNSALGRMLRLGPEVSLPIGTLICNVSGALAIGALGYWLSERSASENARAALLVGLLGGYTTFSAFAFDTWSLTQRGLWQIAILNLMLNNLGALLAVWVGYRGMEKLTAIAS